MTKKRVIPEIHIVREHNKGWEKINKEIKKIDVKIDKVEKTSIEIQKKQKKGE